jgi:hypothetical protein
MDHHNRGLIKLRMRSHTARVQGFRKYASAHVIRNLKTHSQSRPRGAPKKCSGEDLPHPEKTLDNFMCRIVSNDQYEGYSVRISGEFFLSTMYILQLLVVTVSTRIEALILSGNKFLCYSYKEVCCLRVWPHFNPFHQHIQGGTNLLLEYRNILIA